MIKIFVLYKSNTLFHHFNVIITNPILTFHFPKQLSFHCEKQTRTLDTFGRPWKYYIPFYTFLILVLILQTEALSNINLHLIVFCLGRPFFGRNLTQPKKVASLFLFPPTIRQWSSNFFASILIGISNFGIVWNLRNSAKMPGLLQA